MRTYDWLVWIFCLALGWVLPAPRTTRERIGFGVCAVVLLIMLVGLARPGWLP